jgi:peptidoglycan/xylan/chitin deacetylase (PgdA/CDA1 family)
MSLIRQGLRAALAIGLPRERFMVQGPRDGQQVALTFDDGPHPEHTPRLLDRLAALEVRATFFVVGREAERHHDLVARAVREGHAIGHHSWTHSEPAHTSAHELLAEVTRTTTLLAGITGKQCDRFRPPKGALTAAKFASLWRARQRIVLWSADPCDYRLTDSAALTVWAGAHRPTAGEIVLLHDVHPHATGALEAFGAWRHHGISFVTLDAWLPAEQAA